MLRRLFHPHLLALPITLILHLFVVFLHQSLRNSLKPLVMSTKSRTTFLTAQKSTNVFLRSFKFIVMTRVRQKMFMPMYNSCFKRSPNFLLNLSGSYRSPHPPLHPLQLSKKNQHVRAILPCLQLPHPPNMRTIPHQHLIIPQRIPQSCRLLLHIGSTAVLCSHPSPLAPLRHRQLPPAKLRVTRVPFATRDPPMDTLMFPHFLLPTALRLLPNTPPTWPL